jgi:DNA polymerase-1
MDENLTLYTKYWLPFGEILTDMEREGIRVDVEHLRKIQLTAERDKKAYENQFYDWVQRVLPDVKEFNPSSVQQMQQLLFAPYNKRGKKPTEEQLKKGDYEW